MERKGMKPMSHGAVNPMGVSCKGEYCADKMEGTTRPPKRPSKLGTSGVLIDGPYGGKKPQS